MDRLDSKVLLDHRRCFAHSAFSIAGAVDPAKGSGLRYDRILP